MVEAEYNGLTVAVKIIDQVPNPGLVARREGAMYQVREGLAGASTVKSCPLFIRGFQLSAHSIDSYEFLL